MQLTIRINSLTVVIKNNLNYFKYGVKVRDAKKTFSFKGKTTYHLFNRSFLRPKVKRNNLNFSPVTRFKTLLLKMQT